MEAVLLEISVSMVDHPKRIRAPKIGELVGIMHGTHCEIRRVTQNSGQRINTEEKNVFIQFSILLRMGENWDVIGGNRGRGRDAFHR